MNTGTMSTRSGISWMALLPLSLCGCDPVVAVAGAEFPDWLFCVITGTVLSAALYPVLSRAGLERYLKPLALFYGSLIMMFSLVTWVIFFNRA